MISWASVPYFIAPAYFLQTLLHEASHACVAKLQGLQITSFKIWPHKAENRRWYWGRVTYSNTDDVEISSEGIAVRAMAPFASSLFLLSVLASIKLSVEFGPNNVLLTGLDVWIVAMGTDLVRGLLQAFTQEDHGDIHKARMALDTPIEAVHAVAGAGVTLVTATVFALVGPDIIS